MRFLPPSLDMITYCSYLMPSCRGQFRGLSGRELDAAAGVLTSWIGSAGYVVIGADAGSKAAKAKDLGVATLTEDDWLKLIGAA